MKLTKRTVRGVAAATAAILSLLVAACAITGGTAVFGTTSSPPSCTDAPGKLITPTGSPILTVTQGANRWIANPVTEPLALAVYADGTVLGLLELGQADQRLPAMIIGHVQSCVRGWATTQLEELSALPMGDPEITDQGTTEVTYQPASGAKRTIEVYALGEGDQYVSTGRENRTRLTAVLAALRQPLSEAAKWTPDRLSVVEGPPDAGGAALAWPGSAPLAKVLTGLRSTFRCGEVSAPTRPRCSRYSGKGMRPPTGPTAVASPA